MQDSSKNITDFGTLLHHLQDFRCLVQPSASFVAFHAEFQYCSLLLGRIAALLAGFLYKVTGCGARPLLYHSSTDCIRFPYTFSHFPLWQCIVFGFPHIFGPRSFAATHCIRFFIYNRARYLRPANCIRFFICTSEENCNFLKTKKGAQYELLMC